MAKIYFDSDADTAVLENKVLSFIGYGNQGRAQALNLRDSGVKNIIVGNVKDSYYRRAEEDNFKVCPIGEAAEKGDILFMLIPDEFAPEVYKKEIEPHLGPGKVLNFASGYNITFDLIVPPENTDVIMVAPRMIGEGVRELYLSGDGFPSFLAVKNNPSGRAKETALAISKGIGATKKGVIEVRFEDETYLDLIAEQATWPLVITIFTEIYKFLVERGHPQEAILSELYLSKEPAVMFEKMADVGFFKQLPLHSHTSQYGQLSRYEKIDKNYFKDFIREQYENITNGNFSREWSQVKRNDLKELKELYEKALNSDLNRAEEDLVKRFKSADSSSMGGNMEELIQMITKEVLKRIKDENNIS
jgi:ketol-acid reductoisomerase